MVQEHTEDLKLLGTHQLVICADNVPLLDENIPWREVVVISKDDDPDVSAEKAKKTFVSGLQNAGYHNIKVALKMLGKFSANDTNATN